MRSFSLCVFPLLLLVAAISSFAQHPTQSRRGTGAASWQFAVSGDSRNCGDVVVPAIANRVLKTRSEFYWHLGDFRALYGIDEDMQNRYHLKPTTKMDSEYKEYQRIAWGDFISNQVGAFGTLPVHLGIGNHELINKSLDQFLDQFGYWMDTPEIRAQRPQSDIDGNILRPYYHWKQHQIDFIFLDNSTNDGFDDAQIQWFESVLAKDKTDDDVKTIVVGMHRALPNSLGCGHSMNGDPGSESAQSLNGGRQAYIDLAKWKKETGKFVYVLASHSHFYMQDIFETKYWQNRDEVLPGWIVGTAGALRYTLPDLPADVRKKAHARTDVAGFLLATVQKNGAIVFKFKEVGSPQVPKLVRERYDDDFLQACFSANHDSSPHPWPKSCSDE